MWLQEKKHPIRSGDAATGETEHMRATESVSYYCELKIIKRRARVEIERMRNERYTSHTCKTERVHRTQTKWHAHPRTMARALAARGAGTGKSVNS